MFNTHNQIGSAKQKHTPETARHERNFIAEGLNTDNQMGIHINKHIASMNHTKKPSHNMTKTTKHYTITHVVVKTTHTREAYYYTDEC